MELWRGQLGKVNQKAANSLADPAEYENLFPGLKDALKTEQYLRPQRSQLLPANSCSSVPVSATCIYNSLNVGHIVLCSRFKNEIFTNSPVDKFKTSVIIVLNINYFYCGIHTYFSAMKLYCIELRNTDIIISTCMNL